MPYALEEEFVGAPGWVIQGCRAFWDEDEGMICGIGSAGGSRNVSLMRTTAIGRGRRTAFTREAARVESHYADPGDG